MSVQWEAEKPSQVCAHMGKPFDFMHTHLEAIKRTGSQACVRSSGLIFRDEAGMLGRIVMLMAG